MATISDFDCRFRYKIVESFATSRCPVCGRPGICSKIERTKDGAVKLRVWHSPEQAGAWATCLLTTEQMDECAARWRCEGSVGETFLKMSGCRTACDPKTPTPIQEDSDE